MPDDGARTDGITDDAIRADLVIDGEPDHDPDLDPATNPPFDHGINISRDGSTGTPGTTSAPGPGGTTRVLTTGDVEADDADTDGDAGDPERPG